MITRRALKLRPLHVENPSLNTARMGWPWRPRLQVLRIVVLMFCTWEVSRPGRRSDLGMATSVSGMGCDDAELSVSRSLVLAR